MPNDSMGPTDDLVARLRDRINGTGIWRTAGPDEDMQALVERIATLERELEEARRHVELLQNKINGPRECACAYDSPNDICALHSPQLTASRAEVERLREALHKMYRRALNRRIRRALSQQGETG